MVTILIPREPIPVSLTAEQVVAYLLRTGWSQLSEEDSPEWSSFMSRVGRVFVGWPNANTSARYIEEAIADIARAESRPAEQVAADIAGPAVGTVGAGTNAGIPIEEQWSCGECEFNPPRECAGASPTPGEVYWTEAPRAPVEE